jgi:hypothetical protein
MLEIVIERERIRIGPDSVPYDSYFFGVWDWKRRKGLLAGERPASELDLPAELRVIAQWADAIERLAPGQPPVYLPFGLYDESVEAFSAHLTGNNVVLRWVVVEVNGYAINLDNLLKFMYFDHRIEQHRKDFGTYDRSDLIIGLRSARFDAA